jgi:hypothetical protein
MEFENKKLRDVADIAARIMMGEKALHPNQQKLDVHEPEKDELTAKDFEKLRAGKKAEVKKEEVEEVLEDAEQIDELSKTTKAGYIGAASKDVAARGEKAMGLSMFGSKKDVAKYKDKTDKRVDTIGKVAGQLSKEEVEQIDELSNDTLKSYVKGAKEDRVAHKDEKDSALAAGDKETAAYDTKRIAKRSIGIHDAKKKMNKEEIDQAAEFVLEYESKDGKFVHRARPGAYGGTKDEKHAVDTLSGPKEKDLKNIEKDSTMYKKGYHATSKGYLRKDTQDYFAKRFSENLELYKEQGLKGLFEALKKEEVIVEEPTSAEFDAQLADAKQRAAGTKKQAEVSKPAVQAVQNEETHTTVEFIDYNDVNGVKISEIDLDERSLSEPEMKKKEEIVKSMKKGISGFKERYGKDAKSVMYATATKQAKGE